MLSQPLQRYCLLAFLITISAATIHANDRLGRFEIMLSGERGDYGTGDSIIFAYAATRVSYTWDPVEFSLTVPYLFIRGRDAGTQEGSNFGGGFAPVVIGGGEDGVNRNTHGLGDVSLDVDLAAYRNGPFNSGILLGVKFPTADEEKGLGTGEYDWKAGARASWTHDSLTPFAQLTYTWMGEPSGTSYRNPMTALSGIIFKADNKNSLTASLEYRQSINRDTDAAISAYLSYRYDGSRMFCTVTPFKGLNDEAADYGLSLGFGFLF